ncbi:MAG TPA: helix-turn-helix domain-containing protein [Phycisphaerales bacterium]|nr:helix-turn-helix domain-containing protein [Phycisphaerales bacterium]
MKVPERFPIVQRDGVVTHVLVPVEEFHRLVGERDRIPAAPSDAEIDEAMRVLDDAETEWHDADEVLWRVLREGLAPMRKRQGLTQEQLAAALGMSQPQVSRLESNLEGVPIRVLRRVVEALMEHRAAS